ncbi:MAG: His/Gly/Thr/Pro-type tRNA ligase C-terminal domain-containing protein, partial [Planctomycetota bacterium]
ELEGIAHRGEFDLSAHAAASGVKMEYFDQPANKRYIPNVIEPASGLTRAVLVMLCEAYTEDPDRPSGVYMKFKPKFAPIKAGVFPLVNKDGMPEKATAIYRELREVMTCEYDPKQSIGKRYARMDEIGAPFCVTVDGDTATDDSVTVRHRDDQSQERVPVSGLKQYLLERLQ